MLAYHYDSSFSWFHKSLRLKMKLIDILMGSCLLQVLPPLLIQVCSALPFSLHSSHSALLQSLLFICSPLPQSLSPIRVLSFPLLFLSLSLLSAQTKCYFLMGVLPEQDKSSHYRSPSILNLICRGIDHNCYFFICAIIYMSHVSRGTYDSVHHYQASLMFNE